MTGRSSHLAYLSSLAVAFVAASPVVHAQDCTQQLDRAEQAIEQSDVDGEQVDKARQDLDAARKYASDGMKEECLAEAAKIQVALLKMEGIDHSLLCGRTAGEDDVGEADMAGMEDVKSALQSGCEPE